MTYSKMEDVMKEFCSLSVPERSRQSYLIGLTLLHYLDIYNFTYKASFCWWNILYSQFRIKIFDYMSMLSDTLMNKIHLYSFWNYSFILELNRTLEIICCIFAHFINGEINIIALLTLSLYIQDQVLNWIYIILKYEIQMCVCVYIFTVNKH